VAGRDRGRRLGRSSKSHRRKMHDRPGADTSAACTLGGISTTGGVRARLSDRRAVHEREIEIPRGSSRFPARGRAHRCNITFRVSREQRDARTDSRGRQRVEGNRAIAVAAQGARGKPSPTKSLLRPAISSSVSPRRDIYYTAVARDAAARLKRFIPAVLFPSTPRFRLSHPRPR